MAKQRVRKQVNPPVSGFKVFRLVVLILLFCLLAFWGYGALHASVVHVRRADVVLDDLPEAFEGTTILFASDIDLFWPRTGRWARSTFQALQALKPDLLILGGDYVYPGLWGRISGRNDGACEKLFYGLSDFSAPLGKFAVAGDMDGDETALNEASAAAGFQRIDVTPAVLQKGDAKIALVGLPVEDYDLQPLADKFSKDSCVFCVSHLPGQLRRINTAEAADGGSWCDLILCGQTHGGLVRFGSISAYRLNEYERDRVYGWYGDAHQRTLVTSGMGTAGFGLRIGSECEVWLLTLKRGE